MLKYKGMTICIAVIAENTDIIGITDKKFTVNHGVTSAFEITDNKKAVQLTPHCVALFAGNIVNANQLLSSAKKKITDTDSVENVALKIQQVHNDRFKEEVNQQILSKYSLDIDTFNSQQRTLDATFVSTTIETISKSNLGVEILIIGKDKDVPRLIKMSINGALEDDTSSGYVCIGSGSGHAQLSLIESGCHSGMTKESAIYSIIKAKNKAEYDPNVGKMSAMVLIDKKIRFTEDAIVKKLWEEYSKAVNKITGINEQSSTIMKGLLYDTATK
jgi:20S proteasome alpha/beta subunit